MNQIRFMWPCALVVLSLGIVPTVVAAPSYNKPPSARLTESAGGFSYVPPAGWHIRTLPGMKYRLSYATPIGGLAPNINVVDETAAVTLDQYVRANLSQIARVYSAFHLESQTPFVTRSGLHGVRLVSTGTMSDKNVRQIFYIFPARNNRKLLATATWPASLGSRYTAATDASMKTFALL